MQEGVRGRVGEFQRVSGIRGGPAACVIQLPSGRRAV
jgi:hypothetical protein